MKSKLKLRNHIVRRKIVELSRDLTTKFNNVFSISLVDDFAVGEGSIDDKINGSLNVNIGTYGLYQSLFSYVSDFNFVNCVVSMHHEGRHAEQVLTLYRDVSSTKLENNRYLAISHLACQNSHNGYYFANRMKNPREIDAEHIAVLRSYYYLSAQFPNVDCEELILDYVNYKAENSTYYIKHGDKPFESLEEVNDAFDQAFEDSKTALFCRRECRYDAVRHRNYTDSEINHIVGYPEWNDLLNEFWNPDTNGMQQDKMVASVELYLHPEYKGFHI